MRTPTKVRLAALGFLVIAASAFLAIRIGAGETTPITLAGIRFFAAAAGFAVLATVKPNLIRRRFKREDLPWFILTGATGAVIYSLTLFKGQQTASAGTASLIQATIPILASLMAVSFGSERLGRNAWGGVLLAFVGTLIITVDPNTFGRLNAGAGFVLIAALSNAVYFVAVKRIVLRYGALTAVAGTVWTGTALFLPFVFLMQEPSTWSGTAIASGAFLGLVATLGGASSFAYVIGKVGAAKASTVTYLVAPLVVTMEWFLFNESPGPSLLVGGAFTITGLFLARPRFRRESGAVALSPQIDKSSLVVRAAQPSDIGALLDLTRQLAEFQDMDDRFAATEAGIRSGLFGRHRSAEALVAERVDEIVGYAIISQSFSSTRGATKLIVEDIFVAPGRRGEGAGSALFNRIAERGIELGVCYAQWSVLSTNSDAIAFYGRLGAVPAPEWMVCTLEKAELRRLIESGEQRPAPADRPGPPRERRLDPLRQPAGCGEC